MDNINVKTGLVLLALFIFFTGCIQSNETKKETDTTTMQPTDIAKIPTGEPVATKSVEEITPDQTDATEPTKIPEPTFDLENPENMISTPVPKEPEPTPKPTVFMPPETITDAHIEEISSSHILIKNFKEASSDYTINVTALSQDILAKAAEKYPVIYGDTPKEGNIYQIDFSNNDKGYTCIVDASSWQTVRCFRTISFGLDIG